MRVNIPNIVKNLGKNINFLQPLYESITNSLEANATSINIEIYHDEPFEQIMPKMIGFTIQDNGNGFNQKNRNAFMELWTNNKLALGCKGSGRFTWLKVFDKIDIVSYIKEENKKVFIPFKLDFEEDQMEIQDSSVNSNSTIISFSNITPNYYNNVSDGRYRVDFRVNADIDYITNSIKEYLLIKLFLLTKQGKNFSIKIKIDNNERIISSDNIPELQLCKFNIFSDITQKNFLFELYYLFKEDSKNSKKVYFCANGRAILEIDDDSLGFSAGLPNKDSFIMLLCSDYLNDKDNDGRSELSELTGKKQANFDSPLLISDIKFAMKKYMHQVILEKYPQLQDLNKQEEEKAINKAPYLSDIIKENSDILKSESSLLKEAKKEFNIKKEIVINKFEKLLSDRSIDTKEYNKSISEISSIALAELGEYIYYRENIIKALKLAIEENKENEKFYHDIFMPMKTSSSEEDDNKHLLSNIWLLDDKFMTYSYAASDKTVNQIKDEIKEKNENKFKVSHRPDLSIFFNKLDGLKNVVMVEFKSPNADLNEKTKSLTELPDDIAIVKKNIPSIETVWSYIVTTIDEKFEFSIESSENFQQLFSTDEQTKVYYRYLPKANAHVFIIPLTTIVSDSSDRNKTFLDILKQ